MCQSMCVYVCAVVRLRGDLKQIPAVWKKREECKYMRVVKT